MNHEKKLFSIGEITKAAGITRRILLNYEEKGLITPDEKESPMGNRYYSIDTFTQIRTIRMFQELGLSLDEISAYLNDTADLVPIIRRLETMRDSLNASIEKLYERAGKNRNQIREIKVEPQTVYIKEAYTHSIQERSILLKEAAREALRKHTTDISRRMYFIEYPLDNPDDLTYAVSVAPDSIGEKIRSIPGFHAISLYHHGAYEHISEARKMLIAYAEEHHLQPLGICRHVYVEGPPQHKDPSKFITQIILPIHKSIEQKSNTL